MRNERAVIGGNQPPSPIEMASETLTDLNGFLTENPVIETGEQARSGSSFVERTRKSLQDMEDARKAETAPLNDAAKKINERYRTATGPIVGLLNELRTRLTDFAAKEEARRIRQAEEARLRAESLEMEARRAEEAERELKDNATQGEIVDLAAAVVEADQAFSRFEKADRAAAVAERDTHVRLPSQLGGKALSMRAREVLTVDNALKAISEIGSHCKINEAILVAAREYRRQYGRLPAGVSATTTRSI
jgi:dTMP kinase